MHSFISSRFVAEHDIPCKDMPENWSITTGRGSVTCTKICKPILIVVSNREFVGELIVIGNSAFDVILGMNWLGYTHAHIDCHAKKVVFRMPGLTEFEFRAGDVPKIKRSIMELAAEDGVPDVVRDFMDVFPEDLPGLPLDEMSSSVSMSDLVWVQSQSHTIGCRSLSWRSSRSRFKT